MNKKIIIIIAVIVVLLIGVFSRGLTMGPKSELKVEQADSLEDGENGLQVTYPDITTTDRVSRAEKYPFLYRIINALDRFFAGLIQIFRR